MPLTWNIGEFWSGYDQWGKEGSRRHRQIQWPKGNCSGPFVCNLESTVVINRRQKCSTLKPQQKYCQLPPCCTVLTTEWLVQVLVTVQVEPTWEPQCRQGCCGGRKHHTGKLLDPGLHWDNLRPIEPQYYDLNKTSKQVTMASFALTLLRTDVLDRQLLPL